MPDPERLQSLRQQRASLLQRLEMLEKEIARESAAPGAPLTPPSASTPAVASTIVVPRPAITASEGEADALLAHLVASEGNSKPFSKSGCWLIFGAAMLVAISLVGAVYYFFYR